MKNDFLRRMFRDGDASCISLLYNINILFLWLTFCCLTLEASLEESKQRKSSELQKSQDEGEHLHNSNIEVDAESEKVFVRTF